jgi:hypothetical protein
MRPHGQNDEPIEIASAILTDVVALAATTTSLGL